MPRGFYAGRKKLLAIKMKAVQNTRGEIASDFELEDVNGRRVSLSRFRGSRPSILNFLSGFT